jgi:hypothetical protein
MVIYQFCTTRQNLLVLQFALFSASTPHLGLFVFRKFVAFGKNFLFSRVILQKLIQLFKAEYLVKSNQVCARMEIEISDFQLPITKIAVYCNKYLI